MNTTHPTPNYALRRTVAAVLFMLFIYFIGLPVFEFVVRAFCYGVLEVHEVLVNLGWLEPLP